VAEVDAFLVDQPLMDAYYEEIRNFDTKSPE
jgi:hypothetical protein